MQFQDTPVLAWLFGPQKYFFNFYKHIFEYYNITTLCVLVFVVKYIIFLSKWAFISPVYARIISLCNRVYQDNDKLQVWLQFVL